MIINYDEKKPLNTELNSIETQIVSIQQNFEDLQNMYTDKRKDVSRFLETSYFAAQDNLENEDAFVQINALENAIKIIDDNIFSIVDLNKAGDKVCAVMRGVKDKKEKKAKKILYKALDSYNWLLGNNAVKIEENDNKVFSLINQYYNSKNVNTKEDLNTPVIQEGNIPERKFTSKDIQKLINSRRNILKGSSEHKSKVTEDEITHKVDSMVENLLKKYKSSSSDRQVETKKEKYENTAEKLIIQEMVSQTNFDGVQEGSILPEEFFNDAEVNTKQDIYELNKIDVNDLQAKVINNVVEFKNQYTEFEDEEECLKLAFEPYKVDFESVDTYENAVVKKSKVGKKKSKKSDIITKTLDDGTVVKLRKVKKDKNVKDTDYIIKKTKDGKKVKVRNKKVEEPVEKEELSNRVYFEKPVTETVFKKFDYQDDLNYEVAENYIPSFDVEATEKKNNEFVHTFLNANGTKSKARNSKINLHDMLDNNTLVISEKTGRVVLPYYISDIENLFIADNFTQEEVKEVIDSKYTIPLKKYKNAPVARFKETYNLMKYGEDMPTVECLKKSYKMAVNSKLNPAIITACKTHWELDTYIECLNNNELDKFNIFNIKYEAHPHKKFKI